jgi:hypothetical protein
VLGLWPCVTTHSAPTYFEDSGEEREGNRKGERGWVGVGRERLRWEGRGEEGRGGEKRYEQTTKDNQIFDNSQQYETEQSR